MGSSDTHAFRIKAITVNHRVICGKPEHTWTRITHLRQGGDCSHFNTAKAQPEGSHISFGILIKSSCQPDRIIKCHPGNFGWQKQLTSNRGKAQAQRLYRQIMGQFCRKPTCQFCCQSPHQLIQFIPCRFQLSDAGPASSSVRTLSHNATASFRPYSRKKLPIRGPWA